MINKSSIEQFIERVFGINCSEMGRHFKATNDRTVWYTIRNCDATMFVPGMNVLRVNQPELSKFLAAVERFIVFPLDSPLFDWDNLELQEFSGSSCREGIELIKSCIDNNLCEDGLIAVDTETRYLFWDNNKLLSIGFALRDNQCIALYDIPQELYPYLEEILNDERIRYCWHNGKFDKNFLWYTCGVRAKVDEDSMLKHYSQVSEKKGTHGLKYLGPLYLQAPQWDDELDAIKKRYCRENKVKIADFTYDLIPTEVLIPYMQRDCIASRRLLKIFDRIKEPGTDDIYRLLVRSTEVFSWIEMNGAKVDQAHIEELRQEFTTQLNEADKMVADAVKKFWDPMRYSKETSASYVAEFKLNSPKQLKWMLQQATGVAVDSSDKETIERLMELVESKQINVSVEGKQLLDGIMLQRKASKYLGTYVDGMESVIRKDGRVSGTYKLHGTETGRLSSSDPNMQNIPRNKSIKNIFCASPGYQLVQLDMSQCEIRCLGVLSCEPVLIDAYEHDKDLHAQVAELVFGPDFTKEHRSLCKTITFGIMYGRGAAAIASAFNIPKSEAQKIIDDWFKSMPSAEAWIKGQRKAADKGDRQQTIFGRVRHYVKNDENAFHIQNEYINTPIQSIASDLVLMAICELHDWLVQEHLYVPTWGGEQGVRICITVHDSIVMEVQDDPALIRKVAYKCKEIMETVPQKVIKNCPLPFKADIEVGYTWGNLHELEE